MIKVGYESTNESKSAPLYHVTDIEHFIQIAKSNKLKATPNQAKRAYDTRDKISFSRYANHFSGDAKLVLDQEKLAQNYAIQPINVHPDYTRKDGRRSKLYRTQAEERIHKDVTNLINYVLRIYVWDYYSKEYLEEQGVSKQWIDKIIFVDDIDDPRNK